MFKKLFNFDWTLIVVIFLLTGVGLLALYSFSIGVQEFSKNVFLKQAVFAGIGVALMFFFAFIDYHYYQFYARVVYFVSILFLFTVLLWGDVIRGTAGWIGIGPFNLQPVEFAKIAIIVFMASFIVGKKTKIGEIGRVVASFVLIMIIVFLVLRQPDFGSAAVLVLVWLGMIIVSGVSRKLMASLILAGVCFLIAGWFLLAPYQKERIINFINPNLKAQSTGYNVIQSMVAVGSGGILGKGVGQGSQSQLNFLPEKHTDFIFAAVSEEMGITGSLFVLFLYLILLWRVKKIADRTADNLGFLLAVGILVMLFVQIFINIGMNIGIVPVAGIPLPFLSYGGSSMLSFFIAMGILLNINQKKTLSFDETMHSYCVLNTDICRFRIFK